MHAQYQDQYLSMLTLLYIHAQDKQSYISQTEILNIACRIAQSTLLAVVADGDNLPVRLDVVDQTIIQNIH